MFYYLKTRVGTWLIGQRKNGAYDLRMYYPDRGYQSFGSYQDPVLACNTVENFCTGLDLWDLKLIRISNAENMMQKEIEWSVSQTEPNLQALHA